MSDGRPPFGVLFDLDGTLVDSLPTIAAGMSRTLGEFGHDISADEIVPLIGAPMQILAAQLTDVTAEVAEEMYQRYLELYYAELIETTQPLDGAGALLDGLSAAGARLAVVTNKNEHGGKLMVEIQGWTHHFATVIGRDTTAHPKPAPDGTHHALASIGVDVTRAAFVGDTEFDMEAARNADVPVRIGLVGARSGERLEASGATHVVESLAAVEAIVLAHEAATPALGR